MTEILALQGVSKSYGSLLVTDNLTLALNQGEALGIIGPNGAGKTTMFNLISGNVQPDQGFVHFLGREISRLAPAARCKAGIGRTYQIPHPFGGMTVFENLLVGAMFGAGLPESAGAKLAMGVLETTGLAAKANKLAGGLTLLDRKRLELAKALATSPKLLLLDEIGGGLTEHEVHDLIGIIKSIRASGVAIIWIEHVVHALLAVVDRLAVINFGRLLAEGEPAAVMANPEVQAVYLGVEAA
ncbi:ABC transporter ATP-binding protein [Acidocella sp. KAb 2-4]|uniref:ABC transporter ATP-binding protein n=1 Tax=Acidocella sp. KAb 2-4 TaxID=2885158 RepID=UPI001D05DEB2|nr:ABC transporter ATP-binding protein [Acidocella sp. KAb 2-4]MCB5944734.1 ABC transporter ATP-binding protein [Acidocella sp. KAb 2-4]